MDTVNYVDENNMKQGFWVYTNKSKKLPNYKENQVVEEGNYTNNLKTGKWVFYYNNNKIKQVLNYSNNRPSGSAVFYYKNGNKREEGTWSNNKWIGSYTYYYENGAVQNDWSYNKNGQRTGVQRYYYKNGQLMIEGEWSNGKEAGTITEYYEDGFVKSERSFSNGSIDLSKIKKYEPQELLGKVTIIRPKNKKESLNILDVSTSFESEKRLESKDVSPWSGTGERQFFNKEGQVLREGYFENGHLVNGQSYFYNSKGEKQQTITYKDKKVVKETIHKTKD
jgi:antitoxin component YwqK of YwqJK toxin-antitoxin module